MRYINKYKNLELIISEDLLQKIRELGINAYPKEFGGFLIGNYSKDLKKLIINDTILPKSYKNAPTIFERSTNGILDLFDQLYNIKKQYYVGEWHTHPNGMTMYSQTDLNAMINTVKCITVNIKNPILLILSINGKNNIKEEFYLYSENQLIPYDKN